MGAAKKLFYDLWFPKNTQNITIVAPPSTDGLADAELTSSNYALLDRLGDRDTVYALGKLLSRRYQNAVIHLASAEDFTRPSFSQNFVIIGGPGGKDSAPGTLDPLVGNQVCRHFSERLASRFHYSEDCETLHVDNVSYVAKNNRHGHMTKDFGVFTAFVNPYLQSTRIVMIHGIHTLGVLGAARLFDGEIDSATNFDLLEQALSPTWDTLSKGFECFFEVNILYGEVECPILEPANIYPLRNFDAPGHTKNSNEALGKKRSLISAVELRDDIIDRLEVARQQTLAINRESLTDIHNVISSIADPEIMRMEKILEICRQNTKIPPASIQKIKGILNDDFTKTP